MKREADRPPRTRPSRPCRNAPTAGAEPPQHSAFRPEIGRQSEDLRQLPGERPPGVDGLGLRVRRRLDGRGCGPVRPHDVHHRGDGDRSHADDDGSVQQALPSGGHGPVPSAAPGPAEVGARWSISARLWWRGLEASNARELSWPGAEVAELGDALDSKSSGALPRAGSIPAFGTARAEPAQAAERPARPAATRLERPKAAVTRPKSPSCDERAAAGRGYKAQEPRA